MNVAITTSSFGKFSDAPLRLLEENGFTPKMNPHGRALTEEEAIEFLQGCVAVAAGTEPLTAKLMDALPGLKVISRCGTGMDNVDLAAAKSRGIAVRNTPDAPVAAVAELTVALTLALLRDVCRMDRELRSGVWKKRMGLLIAGKRVGLVGMGRIGRAAAAAFAALGAEIAYSDPFVTDAGTRMELDELLGWADIVSLHLPKTGDRPLLDAARLSLMKKGAFLINCARGGLVDEDALYPLLADGSIAGAALDVFGKEPYTGPLAKLDTVILTPHVGSYAKEARIKMETDTIRNIIDALERGKE